MTGPEDGSLFDDSGYYAAQPAEQISFGAALHACDLLHDMGQFEQACADFDDWVARNTTMGDAYVPGVYVIQPTYGFGFTADHDIPAILDWPL